MNISGLQKIQLNFAVVGIVLLRITFFIDEGYSVKLTE